MTRVRNSSKWKPWRNDRAVTRSAALALASVCMIGCSGSVDGSGTREENRIRGLGPAHYFTAPAAWGASSLSDVVLTGDIDGDGDEDIVRFGTTGTFVELANNGQFTEASRWLADFGDQQGWRPSKHPRMLADINGDGKMDIVGFGDAGVITSLSMGTSFAPPVLQIGDFGANQGWNATDHVRTTADVNGDGRADVVAFGQNGVSVAISNGTGFYPYTMTADFGYQQGWRGDRHIRMMADVNGDHRADIVGFGDNDVWVALSTGGTFGGTEHWLSSFGTIGGGWTVAKHPRKLADVDGDGRADIVGFGDDGVWVVKSTGTSFGDPAFWLADLGANRGWTTTTHERLVADVNGDGKADVVGFGDDGVYVGLAGAGSFTLEANGVANFATQQGWDKRFNERMLADVNGDHLKDIVGYGDRETLVSLLGRQQDHPESWAAGGDHERAPGHPAPHDGGRRPAAGVGRGDIGSRARPPRAIPPRHGLRVRSQLQPGRGRVAPHAAVGRRLHHRRTALAPWRSHPGAGGARTLGSLFGGMVQTGFVQIPGYQGAMFAMEICNVADEGKAYVEGESGYLRNQPDNVMYLDWGPWNWVTDKAKKLYHAAADGAEAVYGWGADAIDAVGGKIEEAFERILHSNCALSAFAGLSAAAIAG